MINVFHILNSRGFLTADLSVIMIVCICYASIFIYYWVPSFEIQADILRVLKLSDELSGESGTERRVKISPVFHKKAPNNVFIVKFKISPLG